MTISLSTVASLSDDALLARVTVLAARERQATADLIASLAELDARRLYLGAGCSSLFTYCTHVLHLSEHAAYGRIEAARLARRRPEVLGRLADGSLTLTAICLLGPVLTDENAPELLDAARHKTKRDIELLVARVRPLPAIAATVRKAPQSQLLTSAVPATTAPDPGPVSAETAAKPSRAIAPVCSRPEVRPLAPESYRVQFTLSAAGCQRLHRAQDLLRHCIPNGDVAAVMERALALLVEDLEKKKLAATERPRGARPVKRGSRRIPAAVRREVWRRDGGQCAFVGTRGRCTERGFLELHHVVPFAEGGEASVSNIQLRCRAHNQHEAERWFGADMVKENRPVYGEPPTRSGPSSWFSPGAQLLDAVMARRHAGRLYRIDKLPMNGAP
jgi:hypothetical protein